MAGGTTCLFFINFCNWVFRCGCQSLWAGADAHCNIHAAAGHHCPFCHHGAATSAVMLFLILIPQALLSWWPARWDWRIRLILALLVFPVAGGIAAGVLGWFDGYWT